MQTRVCSYVHMVHFTVHSMFSSAFPTNSQHSIDSLLLSLVGSELTNNE